MRSPIPTCPVNSAASFVTMEPKWKFSTARGYNEFVNLTGLFRCNTLRRIK